tara:strand:+ start:207 stop:422 length:216 start_codon:yes stop_codon:yes gene_type:complete
MTPKEFIDENYFSLTIDCKREINEIYQALKDYAKTEQLTLTDVGCSLPKRKRECNCSGMSDKVKCDFKCYD